MTRTRFMWTPDAEDTMRRLYPDFTADVLARVIGCNTKSVWSKAKRMGLKKSAAFLASSESGRLDGIKGSLTRFQKGSEPWCKGKKLLNHGGHETQFRPGQAPHNHLPVGSLRIAVGYLQIKLTETGYPPRDWVMYHRHLWTQTHGPIPANHMVVFKGPRVTDAALIRLELLECISRQEHMRRHTLHARGPEMAALVQLKGQITRQVNRINREHNERQGETA